MSVRKFETGATRDTDQGKLDFEAFLSPLVLKAYGEFMHENRKQSNGELRPGDNWQKGIPKEEYAKSLIRHVLDFWLSERGYPELARADIKQTLCAIMFNAMGYLYELLKVQESKGDYLEISGP